MLPGLRATLLWCCATLPRSPPTLPCPRSTPPTPGEPPPTPLARPTLARPTEGMPAASARRPLGGRGCESGRGGAAIITSPAPGLRRATDGPLRVHQGAVRADHAVPRPRQPRARRTDGRRAAHQWHSEPNQCPPPLGDRTSATRRFPFTDAGRREARPPALPAPIHPGKAKTAAARMPTGSPSAVPAPPTAALGGRCGLGRMRRSAPNHRPLRAAVGGTIGTVGATRLARWHAVGAARLFHSPSGPEANASQLASTPLWRFASSSNHS
jgi:hypothetical protein